MRGNSNRQYPNDGYWMFQLKGADILFTQICFCETLRPPGINSGKKSLSLKSLPVIGNTFLRFLAV